MSVQCSTHPFLTLGTGCVVCTEATIEGPHPITLGAGCVVHPKATISAKHGPVKIGANCVLEEWSRVVAPDGSGVSMGDFNLIRVGSQVEGSMGRANIVECRAKLHPGSSIGNGCVVSAGLEVDGTLDDETVLYGSPSLASSASHPSTPSARVLGVCQRVKRGQLESNLDEVRPKEILRDMLSKTHRILH